MSDRRSWPVLFYVSLLCFIGLTLWHITTYPPVEIDYPATVYILHNSNTSYSYPLQLLPPDDFQRLIDLDNFTFTILNQPCNESDPLILVLVHSAPKNRDTRQLIRSTWGKNTARVKVLFMIGLSGKKHHANVLEENRKYRDIVQGSFWDSYRNMTYKHEMVLKYSIYYCPKARYILKTDDDVFVNMKLVEEFLTMVLSPFGGSRMLFCNVLKDSMVQRSWRSKWRVSFKEYPDKFYPPYCPGFVILYSPDSVFKLYQAAQNSTYFWIDDVFMTGTLAERVGLNHVDIHDLMMLHSDYQSIERGLSLNRSFLFSSANANRDQIETLWRYVNEHDTPLASLKLPRLL